MATIERLRKRPDFLAAAEGRRFHTERMTAQGRLRGEGGALEGLRLGLTVTKRVGHAVERNRIKRRLRAAVARLAADLPADLAARPADIVLIVRRPALEADFAALGEDLRRAIPAVTRPGGERQPDRRPRRTGGGRPAPTSPRRDGPALATSVGPSQAPSRELSADPNACGTPDGQ